MIPTSLQMGPVPAGSPPGTTPFVRIAPGSTKQLSVGSNLTGGTTSDVTAASTGTVYRSSNSAVASVSDDGLVTGGSPGTAIIFALSGGASGFANVSVSTAVSSVTPTPSAVNFKTQPLFPASPVQLKLQANLANSTTLDLTSGSSGTTYTSTLPAVAIVTADGSSSPRARAPPWCARPRRAGSSWTYR